jgi:DegV family protein with EDD domain
MSYLDNIEISSADFYERLKTAKEMPSTSPPTVEAFKEIYDRIAPECDGIMAILLSGKLSETAAAANAAKEMMGGFPIEVVDSQTTAGGLALVGMEAGKVVKAGGDLAEVCERAREVSKKVRSMVVVDTLEFLHKGGRIGGARRLVGSILSMKPILEIKDGAIEPLETVRSKRNAINALFEIAKADIGSKEDGIHVAVSHSLAIIEAFRFRDHLNQQFSPETMLLTGLSPVIGTHTGPGTIGLAYFVE